MSGPKASVSDPRDAVGAAQAGPVSVGALIGFRAPARHAPVPRRRQSHPPVVGGRCGARSRSALQPRHRDELDELAADLGSRLLAPFTVPCASVLTGTPRRAGCCAKVGPPRSRGPRRRRAVCRRFMTTSTAIRLPCAECDSANGHRRFARGSTAAYRADVASCRACIRAISGPRSRSRRAPPASPRARRARAGSKRRSPRRSPAPRGNRRAARPLRSARIPRPPRRPR